jgi:hypothetical protein
MLRERWFVSDSFNFRSKTFSVLGSPSVSALNTDWPQGPSDKSRQAANGEVIRAAARSTTLHTTAAVHSQP